MVMMRQLALLILSLVLIFMPAAFGLPDEAVGRVVSVISGDSLGIEMLIADARTNNIDSIKLADIQAPSTVTKEGKAAQKYALSLLKNKTVYLDINDNASGARNEWSQLICVIYLMDSEYRPVWPPVNRILVDGGYARLMNIMTAKRAKDNR
jgi:endonuclease YncB( thermonuclease family)